VGLRPTTVLVLAPAFALALLGLAAPPGAAAAELAEDPWGAVAVVPPEPGPHRVWVNDRILRHSVLFDGDSGRVLGMVDGATALSGRPPYLSPDRGEIYVVETIYSRGSRGERTDLVTIYDASTLAVVADIEIPAVTADTGPGIALGAVLDDGRFMAVFNQVPATSVSIVDLESRTFVEEIVTGGCALIYPTGPRRFGMLCGDGSALLVSLDERGRKERITRSKPFFDVVEDPLSAAGVRARGTWTFASFKGYAHEIDFSDDVPDLAARWSLFTDDQRGDSWRVGGLQHLALHRDSGRLYSLVHQGQSGSHKDAGTQIWVYDVGEQSRVAVIDAPNVLPAFARPVMGVERGSWTDWFLTRLAPNPGVHSITVSQDESPLLFARNAEMGAVGVVDATTGELVRDLEEAGISGSLLVVP
jgi:methylamine dehydrogenase heavy chain